MCFKIILLLVVVIIQLLVFLNSPNASARIHPPAHLAIDVSLALNLHLGNIAKLGKPAKKSR